MAVWFLLNIHWRVKRITAVEATEGGEQRRRLLLGYLGRHMCTPMEVVFSILSATSHHHVMAAEGEHLRWSSMVRFGCAPLGLSTITCHPTMVLNRSPPSMPLS
jgi:hypothetical protein